MRTPRAVPILNAYHKHIQVPVHLHDQWTYRLWQDIDLRSFTPITRQIVQCPIFAISRGVSAKKQPSLASSWPVPDDGISIRGKFRNSRWRVANRDWSCWSITWTRAIVRTYAISLPKVAITGSSAQYPSHRTCSTKDVSVGTYRLMPGTWSFQECSEKNQFAYLVRQCILKIATDCTRYHDASWNPQGYLLLDLAQDTEDRLRFRTIYFPRKSLWCALQ